MLTYLKARWFLLCLLTLIVSGLLIGSQGGSEVVSSIKGCIPNRVLTGLTLFLMAFTLDSSQLKAASRTPTPVIFAVLVMLLRRYVCIRLSCRHPCMHAMPCHAWLLMYACTRAVYICLTGLIQLSMF